MQSLIGQDRRSDLEVKFCLCGCGRPVKKRQRFLQGHNAKLMSILRKVENEDLDESVIPELAKKHLVKCACCGKSILPHESGMGSTCRTGQCKCIKIGGN